MREIPKRTHVRNTTTLRAKPDKSGPFDSWLLMEAGPVPSLLTLAVDFHEVVHSVLTGNADVTKPSDLRRTEWIPERHRVRPDTLGRNQRCDLRRPVEPGIPVLACVPEHERRRTSGSHRSVMTRRTLLLDHSQ